MQQPNGELTIAGRKIGFRLGGHRRVHQIPRLVAGFLEDRRPAGPTEASWYTSR
jgi:hypothetical protein